MNTNEFNDFLEDLDIDDNKPKQFSDNDRLELLEIDNSASEYIQNLAFKKVYYGDDDYGETSYEIVPIEKIVGLNNRLGNETNWLELLFSLHKQRNFELYKSHENFEKYINNLNEECEVLPHLLLVNREYYISGDGKHRLTIAKCIGLEKCPAIVSTLKQS